MSKFKPVYSFVGSSGSGKTTFLENLIPVLLQKGYSVGAIKHDAHKFEIDKPGKDSYRLKQAGAKIVSISSAQKMALVQSYEKEYTLEEVILKFYGDVDFILTEGYKKSNIPKFEVYRKANNKPMAAKGREELLGVISDDEPDVNVKQFSLNDYAGVADYLIGISDFTPVNINIQGLDSKYTSPLSEYLTALSKIINVKHINVKIEGD